MRPSGASSAFDESLRGGAVTGRVGNALDQKGSKSLRNLWRNGPAKKDFKIKLREVFTKYIRKNQSACIVSPIFLLSHFNFIHFPREVMLRW